MLMRSLYPERDPLGARAAREPSGVNLSRFESMKLQQAIVVVGFNVADDQIEELAEARIYLPSSRERMQLDEPRVYAVARVHEPGAWRGGSGWATGGGYHMASSALEAALEGAGFDLIEPIDGRGDERMRAAMLGCARCCNPAHTHLTSFFIA